MDDPANDPTVLAGSDELTGKTIGRFQITALLGKGGMGEVYLAEDSLLKRSVAVKRVSTSLRSNPHYRELLIKEAARASQLNDEHVAHIHDVVEHQGEILLVMEYVDGQSLRQRMGKPVTLDEFMSIAVQCCEALVAADQSGIVHRDIKPENIMITTRGRVKICDFGLARQNQWIEETGVLDRTPTVGFRGTPAYMAPEALLNRDPDIRADMFSLGIVFYELLAVKHPFREGNNHIATTDRIIHAAPPSLTNLNAAIPRALVNIIDRLLRKNARERYPNPADLLLALQQIDVRPARPGVALNRAIRPVLGLLVLLLVVTAGFFVWKNIPQRKSATASKEQNLVILPFRAIGGTSDSQFYADGLTETITARLTRDADPSLVQVAPATEVRVKKITDAREARRQFGANLVLAGTLHEEGTVIRLSYSLYDAGTLHQFKADTIAADSSRPFELEEQLVDAVMSVIANGKSRDGRTSNHGTTLPAAYDAYVRGRGYLGSPDTSANVQTAVQSLQRAAELDPSYAAAYAALGEAYSSKYRWTKEPVFIELAKQACDKANDLDARAATSKICLGTVESETGLYEKAALDFERALKLEPANDSAYLGLADTYEKLGKYEAAEKIHQQAIQIKPNYYLGYSRLGQFYLRRTRYNDAANEFQKQIALIPNSEQVYIGIGAAYIYLGRYEDAITVLQRSIELRPTFYGLSNLGSTYLRLHRFDDAVPVFEKAVQLFPRNFILSGNLARAYYWSSFSREQAVAAYQHAVELAGAELQVNSRNADAHILSARYNAMLGNRREALNHLTTALMLRPNVAEYFSIAAVIYNQLGDRSAALAELKKAVDLGWSGSEIETEVEFNNLRQEPEFQKLVQK